MGYWTQEADLDRTHSWRGERTALSLLGPRPSGEHPLTRGRQLYGYGFKEALGSGLLKPKKRKHYVVSKALARSEP
jgi:hypothetical protein